MTELRKQFKKEHPETIGETDKAFDDSNYIDWLEAKVEALKQGQSLPIDSVSGTVGLEDAKKVLLRYDQAIKEEIAVKLEWLRDHGTHAEFCDIITDIRENVLDTYR